MRGGVVSAAVTFRATWTSVSVLFESGLQGTECVSGLGVVPEGCGQGDKGVSMSLHARMGRLFNLLSIGWGDPQGVHLCSHSHCPPCSCLARGS